MASTWFFHTSLSHLTSTLTRKQRAQNQDHTTSMTTNSMLRCVLTIKGPLLSLSGARLESNAH